jgi:hypothetical protein
MRNRKTSELTFCTLLTRGASEVKLAFFLGRAYIVSFHTLGDPGRGRHHVRVRSVALRAPSFARVIVNLLRRLKARFSATLGEEPEVEVALV